MSVETVNLTARIVDSSTFVFIAETWEKELKPYSKAKWKHESHRESGGTYAYELKNGHYFIFPQFSRAGGFHAAHLYMIAKELANVTDQVKATLTDDGLTLETVEGSTRTRVTLKMRDINFGDDPHPVVLGLPVKATD